MKKLIPLMVIFIMASCTPAKILERTIEGETQLKYLDFQPYIDKGFVFSTGGINQNYVPVGVAYYTITPEIIMVFKKTLGVVTESMVERGTGIIENGEEYLIDEEIPRQNKNFDDILAMAYEYAVSKGANGFINLQYNIDKDEKITFSGMLVKIERRTE